MKHPTPQAIARNVEIIRKRTRITKANARNFTMTNEHDRAAECRRIALEDDAVADWMEAQNAGR